MNSNRFIIHELAHPNWKILLELRIGDFQQGFPKHHVSRVVLTNDGFTHFLLEQSESCDLYHIVRICRSSERALVPVTLRFRVETEFRNGISN